MRAMVLREIRRPLALEERPLPEPGHGQVRIRVEASGVCRTDQHIADGELPPPKLPLILGHQVVGRVDRLGPGVKDRQLGERVGVGWLGWTCGECKFCRRGQENLCPKALFTGYHLDGGYAEYTLAFANYTYPLPEEGDPVYMAPWMCAGLTGFRSYRFVRDKRLIGFYGFGAAAHLLAQVAKYEGKRFFAFVRPGDEEAKRFALEMGAEWAGDSTQTPPEPLEGAIVFAPVGSLIPQALKHLEPGGTLVLGGIYMSEIPRMAYELFWHERQIRSVANLTREDARLFLEIAPRIPVTSEVQVFPLEAANEALDALRRGQLRGSAVLKP